MNDSSDSLLEQLLVLRCQTGDEAAFAELIARYHRRVHYYLKKMLASADRADDAMQELWIDVFRSIGKLRDTKSFAPWLYRLARDRAYRERRRAKPQAASVDDFNVAADPNDESFAFDQIEQVHAALDRLAPEHREVLLLRFVESMDYQQIAGVVGCELGTVRSRIHYAKRALRRLLLAERNDYEHERIRIATD